MDEIVNAGALSLASWGQEVTKGGLPRLGLLLWGKTEQKSYSFIR